MTSGTIGRTWQPLPTEKDIVYDMPRSDAEKTILELVNESGGRKFKHITIGYDLCTCSTLATPCEINSTGEPAMSGILLIGYALLEGIYGIYQKYPEVVRAALRFGIEHELSHTTGIYSAGDKIAKKYVKSGKLAITRTSMDERILFNAQEFVLTATSTFSSLEFDHEREYKANLQAMTSRLKEPGMTFEKLEDEIAAEQWLIAGNRYKADPYQNIGDVERACSDYLEKKFPRLGDEFKEQITEKIFEIDREYRRRCKDMTDRPIGHNF